MEVKLSKSVWSPKKTRVAQGSRIVAGMFQVDIRNPSSRKAATLIFRQDLPDQEHLNVAVKRISALGRVDVGGFLGFDEHRRSLETPTAECNSYRAAHMSKHRIRSQEEREGYTYKPLWQER